MKNAINPEEVDGELSYNKCIIKSLSDIDSELMSKQAYLEELFDLRIDGIKVMILPKSSFSLLREEEWVIGFAFPKKKLIFVIEQKDSGRTYDEWIALIVHELVHIFYVARFGTDKPAWFFEGLACYIAGQNKKIIRISLKDLIGGFSKNDFESYSVGYSVLNRILAGGEQ